MEKSLAKFLTIILILLHSFFLFSQIDDLKFVHLSTEKGLSISDVKKIIQDKDGFIWIATSDGLNRYDGLNFKIFKKNSRDTSSLQDNNITTLCIDNGGNLWIGTFSGGLSRYVKEKDCFVNYVNNPKDSNSIIDNTIESSRDRFLWQIMDC